MKKPVVLALTALAATSYACGPRLPGTGARSSGQSGLMDKTYAGANKCNPKSHDRPFVIEWDATDMSSFETHAASDIVVVKYEGCSMKVLDRCRDDSVPGSFGAYKPVEYSSGSLEKIDISDEGELYAKLPLGVATLGGRVSSGERFHMEYYVAGTRSATRDAVYTGDLASNPACQGATHFVYGYNVGAFALGTATQTTAEVEGSLYGFGGGGSKKTSSQTDKSGGDLGLCKAESAKEVAGCKVPVRLTLREIQPGTNPDQAAQHAPDTDASLNAAGQVAAKVEMSEEARAHYDAATQKMNANDGKGCLKELDEHDRLDAKHKSSDPKSGLGFLRAQCVMMAGQCDAGKVQLRQTLEATQGSQMGPEQIDRTVDALAGRYCQGANMSQRDQLLKALQELQQGAYMTKKDKGFCMSAYTTAKRLAPLVKPKDDEDRQVADAERTLYSMAPTCLARAGACDDAYKVFLEALPKETRAGMDKIQDAATREKVLRQTFDSVTSNKCKAK